MGDTWPWMVVAGASAGDTRIFYFGENRPATWTFGLPTGVPFTVEMIDTWNMTLDSIPGTFQDVVEIPAPDKPYCAIRLRTLVQ